MCRAAFKDADIIILDEPTAALDPKQRMRFITDLMKLQEDALPFILLTGWPVPGFVTGSLCLKREEICEIGSHSQLLEKGGYYARLYALQAKYYEENRKKEGEA